MVEIKSVAIIGASGSVGRAVVAAFLKTSIKITVISRADSTATFPPTITVKKIAYDLPSFTSALSGQDAVIACVNSTAVPTEHLLIDAAVAAGVKWFVPSEYGHNTTDERVLSQLSALSAKAGVVSRLREAEGKGLSWTGVITALFFDWGMEHSFLGFDIPTRTATLWDGGKTPFSTINVPSIGLALANLFTSPAALGAAKNNFVYISSVNTTQLEILSALEKVTNSNWTVKYVDSEKMLTEGKEKIASGDFGGVPAVLQGIQFGKEGLADFRKQNEKWNKVLKLDAEETVEETVKRVVGAWKA